MDFKFNLNPSGTESNKSKSSNSKTNENQISFGDLKNGLSFDTKSQAKSSSTKSAGFTMGQKAEYSIIPDKCEYDEFLKKTPEQDKSKANDNNQSVTNQSLRHEKKQFDVKYVPISGFHFDRVFIKSSELEVESDCGAQGFSFRQMSHLSKT